MADLANADVPPPQVPAGDVLSEVDSLSGDDDVDGIAFETKTVSLSEQYANYNKTVADLAKYLKVGGMFELKDGQDYSSYNNINLNPFTWKDYKV